MLNTLLLLWDRVYGWYSLLFPCVKMESNKHWRAKLLTVIKMCVDLKMLDVFITPISKSHLVK